ncbi:hypothetical protein RA307_31735 [Xanthobacteraceae bacterium Astr-EGSB]|uniref:hypothetical protein n=1 Tax=Astrobacterium formosum TaxID=3069710 RepID=UPI0027B10E1D|nr:hypothetical protein [Xanthobacteraceae bacterium Astr-EGSB]
MSGGQINPADPFRCEARQYDGRHWCGRCGLAGAAEPACKTPAECGVTLALMREAALAEASRIEDSVDAAVAMAGRMVAGGAVTLAEPHMGLLRRAVALRSLARLVDRVMADKGILERLKGGGR